MHIKFGEWTPDITPVEMTGLEVANNIIPVVDGYIQLRDVNNFSATVSSTATISWVLGAKSVYAYTGEVYNYAGNGADLFQLAAGSWTKFTRTATSSASSTNIAVPYNSVAEDYWEFEQFNDILVASNYSDLPQYITVGATTVFKNLTDSIRFRTMAVVKNFMVAGNIYDIATSAVHPTRVQWSAFDSVIGSANWTPSSITQSDYQDLGANAGRIQKVVGGEYGVIVTANGIFRLTYIGSPFTFQVDHVLPEIGTAYPRSVCNYGEHVFFLSHGGFISVSNGTTPQHIGRNKVDNHILGQVDLSYYTNVIGSVDQENKLIYWIYPDPTANAGLPNKSVIFDMKSGKWTSADITAWYIYDAMSSYIALDEMTAGSSYPDIDLMTISLDSPFWKGGSRFLGLFSSDKRLGSFNGSAMVATVETGEMTSAPMMRSFVREVRPFVDGGSGISSRIGYRDGQESTIAYTAYANLNSYGVCPHRVSSRFIRAGLKVTGGFTRLVGFEIDASVEGRR